jgi:hypothetical protein
MKKEKTIVLLLIVSLVLSTGFIKKINPIKYKQAYSNLDFKKNNLASYQVQFTFTGFTSLYGPPENCGLFKPDTVTLKGLLSGNENVDRYDPVQYNGENKFCTMNVTGDGPVNTELEIDTSAGYGYIKINYNSKLGKFQRAVQGTCDQPQMIEEQNMVPNETIASIFNGLELRIFSQVKTLSKLDVNKEYPDKMENGKVTVQVLKKLNP